MYDTIVIHYLVQYWTLIMFSLNLHHECLPVISGRRFVFKCDFIEDGNDGVDFNKFVEDRSKYQCCQYRSVSKSETNISPVGKNLIFYNVCPDDLESEESGLDDGDGKHLQYTNEILIIN